VSSACNWTRAGACGLRADVCITTALTDIATTQSADRVRYFPARGDSRLAP